MGSSQRSRPSAGRLASSASGATWRMRLSVFTSPTAPLRSLRTLSTLELEHLVLEFLGKFLVDLADSREHAFLDAAMRLVDDLRRMLDPAHRQRDRPVQLLDLGVERAFEDIDRLPRHGAELGHAVEHRRMQILGPVAYTHLTLPTTPYALSPVVAPSFI